MLQVLQLLLQPLRKAQRLGVARQGEAPQRQALLCIVQLHGAHATMVQQAQLLAGRQRPGLHGAIRPAGQQAGAGQRQQAGGEVQTGGEVNLERGQHVLLGGERRSHLLRTGARQDARCVQGMLMLHVVGSGLEGRGRGRRQAGAPQDDGGLSRSGRRQAPQCPYCPVTHRTRCRLTCAAPPSAPYFRRTIGQSGLPLPACR